MQPLPYLAAYPPQLLSQVRGLIERGELGAWLARRHPEGHAVQSDRALYAYVTELRQRHLRNSAPLSKVMYDASLHPVHGALGTNAFVSRVQGSRLKRSNEVRIASLFRQAPEAFLRMIVVHELAHLKVKAHDKAFYQLCCHMEPDYHQLEFDARVWLSWRELQAGGAAARAPAR
ncbi:MAG: M48 family metallopeptidase [Thauera phenolivorans]|uniref:M48 family metallopeptidase n=1 Tax=Thauera phenolivorans TaxID=1792543 RepID=A0A7X7LX22_9RHOO|nr:M48 family metallopeptidase [Thauera phenolivorans]